MFHHLTAVGGTIYDTTSKEYGFIQNLGEGSSMLMTPDATTLCKVEVPTAAPVPTANHVFGVSNVEDVDNLTESATVTYKPRNFIPLPPFLMEPIHDAITASNGDAKVALVACIKKIKKFDTDHNEDQSLNDKAKVACKPIAL